MTRSFVSLLAAIVALAALTAGGCEDSKGACTPGDTRARSGHAEVCNRSGQWAPYVKPTVRPLPKPAPNWQEISA